ncbi:very short patch repair endonuclease [Sphingomonas sp.]|uniref:very short patch repair endonuclease n=1 Tax=Sphingomonas sp. TaxID=28214 RepID=UPI0038A7FEA4
MTDPLTPEKRSRHMAAIKGRNTQPERIVRSTLHAAGYRFRIHYNALPGRPDVAFPGRRKAIQVHGCFWHAHGCGGSHTPATRTEYWAAKFARNKARDARQLAEAKERGWDVMVVWECELKDKALPDRLRAFVGPTRLGQKGRPK